MLGTLCALTIVALVVGAASFVKSIRAQDTSNQQTQLIQQQQARDLLCIQAWALAVNARSDALNDLSQPRNDALDALILAAINREPAERLRALAQAYKSASLAYRQGLKDNPIPPSPQFLCARGVLGGGPVPTPTVGPSRAPSPTPSPSSPVVAPPPARPTSSPRPSASPSTSTRRRTASLPRPAPTAARTTRRGHGVTVSRRHPVTSRPSDRVLARVLCTRGFPGHGRRTFRPCE